MLDDDGYYPSDAELATIRDWPITGMADAEKLLAYVQERWEYPDFFTVAKRRKRDWRKGPLRRSYFVSTAGWSGNELMITALEQNVVFWMLTWHYHRRGGHYEFRVG